MSSITNALWVMSYWQFPCMGQCLFHVKIHPDLCSWFISGYLLRPFNSLVGWRLPHLLQPCPLRGRTHSHLSLLRGVIAGNPRWKFQMFHDFAMTMAIVHEYSSIKNNSRLFSRVGEWLKFKSNNWEWLDFLYKHGILFANGLGNLNNIVELQV